jgi:hypothetical protein
MNGSRHNLATVAESLGPVWSLYYRQGYEEGYRRAGDDLIRSLVALLEQYIAQRPEAVKAEVAAGLRRVLYPFEEYLERRIDRMSPDDAGWVEGGMGI